MDKNLIEKYANSDEALAILFVKKHLKVADNKKWIYILEYYRPNDFDSYDEEQEFICNENPRLVFTKVICELFGRKKKPNYPPQNGMDEEKYKELCRAICWETANKDISDQRKIGVKGPVFEIKGYLKKIKHNNYFVKNAPPEIKTLEKNLNDMTNPLWDKASEYIQPDEYKFKITSVNYLKDYYEK